MIPVNSVVSESSASPPTSSRNIAPTPAPQPPIPPTEASAPPARFYSVGALGIAAAVMGAYALVSYVRPHSIVEFPLGLFALLFAPGYALAAVLFSRQPGLSWTVNLPITVCLSVVFNVLIGIALLRVGPGLSTRDSSVADLAVAVFGLLVLLARERYDARSPRSVSVAQDLVGPVRVLRQRLRLQGYSRRQRTTAITLLVLIVIVFGFIGYVAVAQPHERLAVSLAIYGPGGTVVSLPSNGTNTTVLSVLLSVSNNGTSQGLEILVLAELVLHPHASPTMIPWSQPLTLKPATESSLALQLGAGKNVTVPVSFNVAEVGNYTMSFILADTAGTQLRSIYLPLMIT